MTEDIHTSREMTDEVRQMVTGGEFLGEKGEYSKLTGALGEKGAHTPDSAWDLVAGKVVEFLPDYLTEGFIHCSLAAIREEGACKQAVASGQRELTIKPGDRFPTLPFKTFYPYLRFILRAGPVDILTMTSKFKVEGKMQLKEAKILFSGDQIRKISGTIMVTMKISLCKGTFPARIHQFERAIQVS
jgi:hypothetical protein